MSEHTILMVEDNPDVMNINRIAFTRRGYNVLEAKTVAEGIAALRDNRVDVIVLDVMLPDGNGIDFCREARGITGAPVLFLTAKGESADELMGFDAGGDDYISKPYNLDILLARVDALLRRSGKTMFTLAGLRVDFTSRRAYVNGIDALLKTKEFSILETLVNNRGSYMNAQELYDTVWAMNPADGLSTVRTHIYQLRGKLSGAGVVIEQKYGKGYRLNV